MIFKDVREAQPYPDHRMALRGWAGVPPRPVRMEELVTTTANAPAISSTARTASEGGGYQLRRGVVHARSVLAISDSSSSPAAMATTNFSPSSTLGAVRSAPLIQ